MSSALMLYINFRMAHINVRAHLNKVLHPGAVDPGPRRSLLSTKKFHLLTWLIQLRYIYMQTQRAHTQIYVCM